MVRTRDCKFFHYDSEGYPICGRCGLFCTPTEDEKCPDLVLKEEEKKEDKE